MIMITRQCHVNKAIVAKRDLNLCIKNQNRVK